MLLTAQFLTNLQNVNSFDVQSYATFTEGDSPDIYLQLVDATNDNLRYVAAAGATLQVTVDHINDVRKLVRFATQPFSGDGSIWKLSLLSTDQVLGTVSLKLKLTEGTKVTSAIVKGGLRVSSAVNL